MGRFGDVLLFPTTSSNNPGRDLPIIAASGVVASVLAVQLITPADPIGRCIRFWKQLNAHVS